MIIVFLLNSLIALSVFLLLSRYWRNVSLASRFLSFSVVSYALIIGLQLLLGFFGKLFLPYLIISCLALFLICIFLSNPRLISSSLKDIPNELGVSRTTLFCLSFLLGFAFVKIAINLVNPPFGWDSLNYHFTFPVEWLKSGNLGNPITINDDLGPTYYPINGSLVYSWFMLPLKNVFLADLGQAQFFVISFAALYGICRMLSVNKEYSFYAASIFSITPNYFKQLEIAYVDVIVCAWFLAGVFFLISFYHTRKYRDVVFFAISLGILIGTKTIALPYAAVLIVLFLIVLFAVLKNQPYRAGFYIFTAFCAILAFGGYSYLRNYYQTGNPLYPYRVTMLGRFLFNGVFDKTNYTSHFTLADYRIDKLLFHEGLGAGVVIFLIPGFIVYIASLFKRKISMDKFFILMIPAALFVIWRYFIPLANVRYLYPALAIGYVLPFSALPDKKPHIIIARVLVVICILASCAEISSRLELVLSFFISIVLFFILKYAYRQIRSFKIYRLALAVFVLILGFYALNADYNKNEYVRYANMVKYSGFWPDATKAWCWLNKHTDGNNVAYVGRPVPFPLYGTNFKNSVYYVSVNDVDPVMIHYFPNSRYRWGADFMELHENLKADGNYRQHPDYNTWLSNLKRRQTDLLFIYSLHQTKHIVFPIEDSWAKANPDIFRLEYSNSIVHIYKIK